MILRIIIILERNVEELQEILNRILIMQEIVSIITTAPLCMYINNKLHSQYKFH